MAAAKRKHVSTAEAGAPAGYTAIPVKLSEKQQSPHYLYVKEHKVREGTDTTHPPNRTLFVLNIPPYCTKACLSRLFSCCSSVQSVNVCEKPGPREKPEAPKSKFFNLKTVTVKLRETLRRAEGKGACCRTGIGNLWHTCRRWRLSQLCS
ncbi:ribosomal RNA-processing protein 7 homolog A [Trachemys scripta elegans]|uniref:ribosomal RNA-processing protein 7 homolog A n=1 Tax=Trachemys scripta elegans TaxID=31138 RepID=UPI001555F44B|nr:ribosomal RNA-processing protein 7 homolog A [Trachemys scripta elegans]